jgi:hypothetical protein
MEGYWSKVMVLYCMSKVCKVLEGTVMYLEGIFMYIFNYG